MRHGDGFRALLLRDLMTGRELEHWTALIYPRTEYIFLLCLFVRLLIAILAQQNRMITK